MLASGESLVISPVTSSDFVVTDDAGRGYLYPNPTDGITTLSFRTVQEEEVFISLYTIEGKMVRNRTNFLNQGAHRFQIQFPAPGIYYIHAVTDEQSLSYKVVYLGRSQQSGAIEYLGSAPSTIHSKTVKSGNTNKILEYSEGDLVHYVVYSDDHTTVISDSPTTSKSIDVDFYDCMDPDKRSYKIVQIGDQWWMAENLAYLPAVHGSSSGSYTEPCYYVYGYQGTDVAAAKKHSNYDTYGVLYNWPAAKTACPAGWHLPSDEEWEKLAQYISDQKGPYSKAGDERLDYDWLEAGKHLKTINGWKSMGWSHNGNGTDDFGFSALPGGCRGSYGSTDLIGIYGYWWSSEEFYPDAVWKWGLYYLNSNFILRRQAKDDGHSIRCVRD